ncbi:hypothetical protein HMPREF9123_1898 [Neisseria bacilliformis ATCC BAA-1200]|uniref:Uncharacterized protein n=1 Tax=Neisseria bacilliformis ATCC BAA-1200 TaxID=888742 RepID=F2BDT4_9NEIS|nr:hypothetical protein HMPREF9123_1898 [Neisseria bacilliformis ATCC BAA-1200]
MPSFPRRRESCSGCKWRCLPYRPSESTSGSLKNRFSGFQAALLFTARDWV